MSSPNTARLLRKIRFFLLLLAVVAISIFVGPYIFPALLGLFAGLVMIALYILLDDGGVVQHRVVSPDQRTTAIVVRDDCGATCSCRIRVDLQQQTYTHQEVYRSWTACDATINWLNNDEFLVVDDSGQQKQIDIRTVTSTK